MKEIIGKARTIRELLHSRKYIIDYFQREYKWDTKHVVELLNDLTNDFLEDYDVAHNRMEVAKYGHYFLGSVIISTPDSDSSIVDGQQRLTTITLLLIYLNNLQRERADKVPVEELINSERFGKRSFNIDVDERADAMNALFENNMKYDPTGKSEAVQNLINRYQDIDEAFPDELRDRALPYFLDWLIEHVHIVEITAYSDNDAYKIFETMNDRGLSLSPIDHLKGFLLSNISDQDKRISANDLWRKRVLELAQIEKDAETDFFKSWLRSQFAITIRKRDKGAEPGDFDRIGSEFHRWVRDSADDLNLRTDSDFYDFIARRFDFFSRQYKRILNASTQLQEGLEHIFYNAQAGFTLQPMILLAPLKLGDDDATVNRKWRITAKYIDILLTRRLWNYRSIDQSTMRNPAFQVTVEIRGLDPLPLAEMLKAKLDSDVETLKGREVFALHGTNGKAIARILARLTDYVETQSGQASRYIEYCVRGGRNAYEIEHIWAAHPERHTAEFPKEDEFWTYRGHIGDLLLLPKPFNASYGDMPYDAKLPYYLQQNLLAKSLSNAAYDHNPQFLAFIERSGLPIKAHVLFNKSDVDDRSVLYRMLAEKIWDAEALLSISE